MAARRLRTGLAAILPVLLLTPGPGGRLEAGAGADLPQWPIGAPNPFLVPPPTVVKDATVIGQVVDAKGDGISHALVKISSRGQSQARLTNESGWFYFLGVPAGDAHLSASRPGYLDGAWGRRRADGSDLALPLYDGQWVTNATVELTRPAVIAGSVTDETNDAIAGVVVQAFRQTAIAGHTRLDPAGRARTDDRGEYRLTDLPPGEYVVAVPSVSATVPLDTIEAIATSGSVTLDLAALLTLNGGLGAVRAGAASGFLFDADGKDALLVGEAATPPEPAGGKTFVYPSQYFPGTELVDLAMPVTVAAGETRSDVYFQLRPVVATRVEGTVVGPQGPVGGRLLRLLPDGRDVAGLGSETATTITAPDGSFVFTRVPPGRFTIDAQGATRVFMATPPGQLGGTPLAGQAGTATPRMLDDTLGGHRNIAVGDTGLRDVIVTLTPGTKITGHLVIDGSSSPPPATWRSSPIVVEPVDGSRSGVPETIVDDQGAFAIAGVPAGRYFVRMPTPPHGWAVASVAWQGLDVSREPLDTGFTGDTADLVVTLTDRPTEINGTVRDARRNAVPGAAVVAFPDVRHALVDYGAHPPDLRLIRADASGVFVLRGLPPGEYFLAAMDDADADNWQAPARLDALSRRAVKIRLDAGQIRVQDLALETRR